MNLQNTYWLLSKQYNLFQLIYKCLGYTQNQSTPFKSSKEVWFAFGSLQTWDPNKSSALNNATQIEIFCTAMFSEHVLVNIGRFRCARLHALTVSLVTSWGMMGYEWNEDAWKGEEEGWSSSKRSASLMWSTSWAEVYKSNNILSLKDFISCFANPIITGCHMGCICYQEHMAKKLNLIAFLAQESQSTKFTKVNCKMSCKETHYGSTSTILGSHGRIIHRNSSTTFLRYVNHQINSYFKQRSRYSAVNCSLA